jgi:hypothetical protein
MTLSLTRSPAPLREALYVLSFAQRVPDADLLDDIVRQFPEHADALTDFAIEITLDALRGEAAAEAAEAVISPSKVSPAVSRAMSRFQNRLHAVKQATSALRTATVPLAEDVPNPFTRLNRDDFRSFAGRIGANNVFVAKLRDRQIQPETIPQRFHQLAADALRAPREVVIAHFAAANNAAVPGRQFYKADGKLDAGRRQSFAEAVASSGLTEEQKQQLLSL